MTTTAQPETPPRHHADRPAPSQDVAARMAALPLEELRLALVLNGGVSLAVWMGGVAHEINRLTLSTPGGDTAYGPILQAARSTSAVDVIAGTSAGGINGAALALAQTNQAADLLALRTLWAEQGRMEELLRKPFRGKPTSLLRGDDYFLPELGRAMRMLTEPFVPRTDGDSSPRIDLTLTTTLLTGAQQVTIDGFGEKIPQRIHAGSFRFSNIADDGGPADEDPFDAAHVKRTARALALAARCTASFPFAFEPSFVPVGRLGPDNRLEPDDQLRPDMSPYASWYDEEQGDTDQSRYALDGGVLANTPIPYALQAIHRRHIEKPMRRALLLVFPHAPQARTIEADRITDPPTAGGSLAGVFGALQSQGSRSYVESIDSHNQVAAAWAGGRNQLLRGFDDTTSQAAEIYAFVKAAWHQYRYVRMQQATETLAGSVRHVEHWPNTRIVRAAESAQQEWVGQHGDLPYVPADFPWPDPEWQHEHLEQTDRWTWGDSAATGVASAVAYVLRAALSVADERQVPPLSAARAEVGKQMADIRSARRGLDRVWSGDPYLASLTPDKAYWHGRIHSYDIAMQPAGASEGGHPAEDWLPAPAEPVDGSATPDRERAIRGLRGVAGIGGRINDDVRAVIAQLVSQRAVLRTIADRDSGADEISGVRSWIRYLFDEAVVPGEPAADEHRLLLRLLALDAATRLMTGGTPTGTNAEIKLAELSLRVPHPWAHLSTTPDDKAAGLELNRFGGFLKRSWRVNDWIWGRLDAITALCQLTFEPARLKRMATMLAVPGSDSADPLVVAATLHDVLRTRLYGDVTLPPTLAHLEDAAWQDLRRLLDPESDEEPLHLPDLAAWAALPLQAEMILEELPALRAAIDLDLEDGAGSPTRGTRFLAEQKCLLQAVADAAATPAPEWPLGQDRLTLGLRALQAFDAAGIGREPLSEETGSNALIRTVSNAAGVMATVLDTDAARIPAARPVTSAVRGALMLPHWLVVGLAGGGRIAKFLATAGLLVGALFLVLSLFDVLGDLAAAAGLIGTASLLAALAYAALKTGSLLHACALLAPVAPLVAYAVDETDHGDGAGPRVLAVLAAVTALYILANIPWPMTSPAAWVGDRYRHVRRTTVPALRCWWAGRGRTFVVVVVVVLAAVVVGGWLLVAVVGRSDLREAVEDVAGLLADELWVEIVAVVAVAVLGGAIAYREGILLRTWRSTGQEDTTYTAEGVRGWFSRENVRNPAGIAANWAPVYGTGYLLLAVTAWTWFVRDTDQPEAWQTFTVWWLVAIGLLLCLVAPVAVARRPHRQVRRLVTRYWPQVRAEATARAGTVTSALFPAPAQREQLLLYTLQKYDATFCALVHGVREPGRGKPVARSLVLTRRGLRLLAGLTGDTGTGEEVRDVGRPGPAAPLGERRRGLAGAAPHG